MLRGVPKRALLVGALMVLAGASSLPASARQHADKVAAARARSKESAPLQCVLESIATLDVRVTTPRGRRTPSRTQVVHLEQRHISFEPITTSLARVRTHEGEPAVVGDARQPWTLRVGAAFDTSGVHILPGARVLRFAVRGDALTADLDLGDSVELRSARIPCASLTLNTTPTSAASEPTPTRGRRVHARAQTVALRERAEHGIEAVRLRVPRGVTWEELGRREPFLHVHTTLPFAVVDAWAFDTDWSESGR